MATTIFEEAERAFDGELGGGPWQTVRRLAHNVRHPPQVVQRMLKNPVSLTGIVLVIFFVVIAIVAPVLAPPERLEEPYRIPRDGYLAEPKPPSSEHIFGTTEGQYDIYYGVIWGTRTAFRVGVLITMATILLGLLVGTTSGYFGGWLDEVLMRIVEVFMGFPFLLAAITLAAVLGTSPRFDRITTGMIALIAFGWTTYARLLRGDILSVKERDYVMAARTLGSSHLRIMMRHVIPNSIFPTLVVASTSIGSYVLNFAALSFLGLGAEPGYADWGQLISFARNWMPSLAEYWYILVYPGIAILLFVLGWNLIGDAFRDILDPKLARERR
ncbi:MAG: ABC transporter permease subunit [Anaerolineae bacterium]|nr:ABC transporter permease subunit [Anaerolineae bacterium]NIN99447.1 ABC transporter permease subunit [Anaerolineae bacterium]NIQ82312.1 ABC transporter permease subunit [Anaerolineae bacterium]